MDVLTSWCVTYGRTRFELALSEVNYTGISSVIFRFSRNYFCALIVTCLVQYAIVTDYRTCVCKCYELHAVRLLW